jgi:putative transposase
MKQSQFTPEQIIAILQEAESGEKPIAEIARSHGITETTFYRWRRKYGGLAVPEAHRLKELERENGRLKRLLAERDLEVDLLREYLAKK